MNARELAKLLGVHPETIRRMIRSGEIKADKKGRQYIIPEEERDRLVDMAKQSNDERYSKLLYENIQLKTKIGTLQSELITIRDVIDNLLNKEWH